MFENNDNFPFSVGGPAASVTSSHPSAIQIFQLWQIYISNVNPLLKISHVPTLQGQIVAAGANPSKIPRPLEALMFGIYFIAITSLKDEEVQSTFGDDRSVLLAKYHTATQQALVNVGFMRSTEIMVLQAYTLYLVSVAWQPSSKHSDHLSSTRRGLIRAIVVCPSIHRSSYAFLPNWHCGKGCYPSGITPRWSTVWHITIRHGTKKTALVADRHA
jgi:hypothetical protein